MPFLSDMLDQSRRQQDEEQALARENLAEASLLQAHLSHRSALHSRFRFDPAAVMDCLRAVLDACAAYRKGLPLMVLALADNGRELELADEADVPLLFEAFADRAYLPDGRLAPRRLGGAVHHDPQRIIEQALAIARGEAFPDYDGNPLRLTADSLCVHGDNPESLAVLRRLRAALDSL